MSGPEVKNFDVRSYGDWNRVQDVIESKHWWAILHIYPFASVNNGCQVGTIPA